MFDGFDDGALQENELATEYLVNNLPTLSDVGESTIIKKSSIGIIEWRFFLLDCGLS